MLDLPDRYKRLNEVSSEVAKTIKGGKGELTELSEPAAQKAAMLKASQIKRQLNDLNTAFHQFESALMSYRG